MAAFYHFEPHPKPLPVYREGLEDNFTPPLRLRGGGRGEGLNESPNHPGFIAFATTLIFSTGCFPAVRAVPHHLATTKQRIADSPRLD